MGGPPGSSLGTLSLSAGRVCRGAPSSPPEVTPPAACSPVAVGAVGAQVPCPSWAPSPWALM